MISIKLKPNQDTIIKLKACGLTNSEINRILDALTPEFEVKADKATTLSGYGIEDAYNKDEVDDKIKQVSIEEVEYSDIDNIIESGVYKLMQGDGTTRQGDGMWLVVSRSSDPIDSVIYVIQYMFSPAISEIESRVRNPMSGEWFDWESIGSGAGAVSSVNGQVGDVELSLSDINSFLTADDSNFLYKQSGETYFSVGYGGISAKGEGGSGYSISVTSGGLSINGNPYHDNDIVLNQINWVDENDMSQGTVTTTHKLSAKADKTSILITSESSLILTHNQEARLGEITTLTLSMPETIDDLYWSSFCFASGANATSLNYSGEPIIWCGDDCDVDGSFIPEANTKYEVHIKKLGADIVARVGAY